MDWVDVFTRPVYKHIIIDSLKYCQQRKGLDVYAWCLMSNHLHMVAGMKDGSENTLSDFLRDFKKFMNKRILTEINSGHESRKKWMLSRFDLLGDIILKFKTISFGKMEMKLKEFIHRSFCIRK